MPETTSSSRANLPPAGEDDDLLLGEQTAVVAFRFFLIVGVVSLALVLQGIFLLGWEPSQHGNFAQAECAAQFRPLSGAWR
jgi:hypothetical protein